ncbi:DUF397 domain-containing protein [Streptomyces sp. 35G-GA-8]|uniref:DUF397 domain-containing protein n=1 Tax=Streptomyces sp. 35G-GA-8 TaxID=2939434 RepID=UPI00201F7222|nr:DUF397 domain-containing protein [Streptomyces sp. 35G-GA-8]MCL7377115.1 DUF397 domain-containing protein [Streptomyces sp. 35G-GA-8]
MSTFDLSAAQWEKSSYSSGQGGECVEFSRSFLAVSGAQWEKSSYSSTIEGECVEFARNLAPTGIVPVRDSKSPTGPVLLLTPTAWNDFVAFVAQ